jgi:glutathione S-transferase
LEYLKMLQLHYYPGTAAMAPHILLEEIGAPFQLVLVDRMADAHKAPSYLKLNLNGLIPVLTDGDLVLYESVAIGLYLCDKYPDAGLAPALGTAERAHFYKWMVWLTNTLQSTLIVYFYPERWVNEGNTTGAALVKTQAQRKVGNLLDQLDCELARHGGPWLLGKDYSALDPFATMLCRWTRGFSSAPARSRTHLGPYLQGVLARPAVQRVFATEQLAQPWV